MCFLRKYRTSLLVPALAHSDCFARDLAGTLLDAGSLWSSSLFFPVGQFMQVFSLQSSPSLTQLSLQLSKPHFKIRLRMELWLSSCPACACP